MATAMVQKHENAWRFSRREYDAGDRNAGRRGDVHSGKWNLIM